MSPSERVHRTPVKKGNMQLTTSCSTQMLDIVDITNHFLYYTPGAIHQLVVGLISDIFLGISLVVRKNVHPVGNRKMKILRF